MTFLLRRPRIDIFDSVLLLDEADVFLAKREKTDLNRNTLVSSKL